MQQLIAEPYHAGIETRVGHRLGENRGIEIGVRSGAAHLLDETLLDAFSVGGPGVGKLLLQSAPFFAERLLRVLGAGVGAEFMAAPSFARSNEQARRAGLFAGVFTRHCGRRMQAMPGEFESVAPSGDTGPFDIDYRVLSRPVAMLPGCSRTFAGGRDIERRIGIDAGDREIACLAQ